jgi:uncharacterized phage-associated protein
MARAIDVARQLVCLASAEDEPDYLSHMRLQKLLYYVQAWSLANRGRPMFPERIEAWAHGPVVRDLFKTFTTYGDRPILPEDVVCQEIDLDEDDRAFIAGVWESFKDYSSTSLRRMTHEESPWIEARKGFGPGDSCSNEITVEAIQAYFATQGA